MAKLVHIAQNRRAAVIRAVRNLLYAVIEFVAHIIDSLVPIITCGFVETRFGLHLALWELKLSE